MKFLSILKSRYFKYKKSINIHILVVVYYPFKFIEQTGAYEKNLLILIRGPYYYRTSNGKGRFIFPWNTNILRFDKFDLPVSFYGIKGKQLISPDFLKSSMVEWSIDNEWLNIEQNQKDVFLTKYLSNDLDAILVKTIIPLKKAESITIRPIEWPLKKKIPQNLLLIQSK